MPTVSAGSFQVDYIDAGSGPSVLLVPSTASGNRQWRALIEAGGDRFRFLAMNMFGYGDTSPWPATQITLDLGSRVRGLALFEPNPFHLLRAAGEHAGHDEGRRIRDIVKQRGGARDWMGLAEAFADYWVGDGTWAAMPEGRRKSFATALAPNFHEWDTLYAEARDDDVVSFDLEQLQALSCPVLVLRSESPRPGIAAIDGLLRRSLPDWQFGEVAAGGHMAPIARSDLVNPLLLEFFHRVN